MPDSVVTDCDITDEYVNKILKKTVKTRRTPTKEESRERETAEKIRCGRDCSAELGDTASGGRYRRVGMTDRNRR